MARPKTPERIERLQLRRLLGEIDARDAVDLDALEAADTASRDRADRLRSTWDALQPPPEVEAPRLAPQIMAAVRAEEATTGFAWIFSGGRVASGPRLAAFAMLLVGTALGLWLSPSLSPAAPVASAAVSAAWAGGGPDGDLAVLVPDAAPSLAEAYWRALEETGGELSALELEEPEL